MNPTHTAQVHVGRDDDGPIEVAADFVDGTDDAPPALLLSAAEEPASRWPHALIEALAARCGGVVSFDTRGIGRNRSVRPGYGLDDLATDACAVLDQFGVERAHVIGRSMGGMVAQLLALDSPQRVASLTLVSTSAGPDDRVGGPAEWFLEAMSQRLLEGPPDAPVERVGWIVEQLRWFAGPRFEFDEAEAEQAAVEIVSDWWHDEVGHGHAVVEAAPRYNRLAELSQPTLVVHGTADPVYAVAHGQALAEGIPHAEIVLVEGLGHEFPAAFVPQFIDAWSARIG